MDKNEILEKSRHENICGDERDKLINLKSIHFANIFGSIAFIILIIISLYKKTNTAQAGFLYLSFVLGQCIYMLKEKNFNSNLEFIGSLFLLFGGIILLITYFRKILSM